MGLGRFDGGSVANSAAWTSSGAAGVRHIAAVILRTVYAAQIQCCLSSQVMAGGRAFGPHDRRAQGEEKMASGD